MLRSLLLVATHIVNVKMVEIMCANYRSLLQNIVSFIGLFCKREQSMIHVTHLNESRRTNYLLGEAKET